MSANQDMRLPSGAMCTVCPPGAGYAGGEREYYVWSGNGHLARLTAADVEVLFADSIASHGQRIELARDPLDALCVCGCRRRMHRGHGRVPKLPRGPSHCVGGDHACLGYREIP